LIAAATDWNAVASIASSNLTDLVTALISGHITYINGYRTCSSGVALNANFNPSAAPDFNWAQIIVRAAAGGSPPTSLPPTRRADMGALLHF
jgi:hypothetical protein